MAKLPWLLSGHVGVFLLLNAILKLFGKGQLSLLSLLFLQTWDGSLLRFPGYAVQVRSGDHVFKERLCLACQVQ